jgi:glutamate/tyrosine decarboxylase-like PLP-dependent enzyme
MELGSLDKLQSVLGRVDPRLVTWLEKRLAGLPFVAERLERQYAGIVADLEDSLKPYKAEFTTFESLPAEGRSQAQVLEEMAVLQAREQTRWESGYASGAVYHGDSKHVDFLNQVYALCSQANPLHADLWPSSSKFEAEVISMTAQMLGAGRQPICGAVSSGGTESILLAMKTYRDHARETKGIKKPEMVLPTSAHVAFDKAAHYFGIKPVRIPVGRDGRARVKAARRALSRNTVVVVGSAPSFPHGVIDPIEELSELARRKGIGFHTDGCLGGFLLPWAEKLGYPVPAFDFRLPGVTSMSADTHKYGFAAKGTSVVLYRGEKLRRYQYYAASDWPGGLYFSPTLAGSRPGALSAACWAALVCTGEKGYLDAARKILATAASIKEQVARIPELRLIGDPLFCLALVSDVLDIYQILDFMTRRGWSLNGLHKPPAFHLCITLRHAQPGVAERFIDDLRSAVEWAKAHPEDKRGLTPIYGLANALPLRGVVRELLKRYVDLLYRV